MKQIQAISIWDKGEAKDATQFSLMSINDNLESSATFYYQLLNADVASLADGNLTISGQDYENWGNQSGTDINTWAYQWAATQLNITII